jgi:hypothetical protein
VVQAEANKATETNTPTQRDPTMLVRQHRQKGGRAPWLLRGRARCSVGMGHDERAPGLATLGLQGVGRMPPAAAAG